jgi:hypothetical protein
MPTATTPVGAAPDRSTVLDCACGIDVSGLRLPGLATLPICPEGCIDGAVLARHLAAIDPAELLTDAEVLDLVTALSRVTSWMQALGCAASQSSRVARSPRPAATRSSPGPGGAGWAPMRGGTQLPSSGPR